MNSTRLSPTILMEPVWALGLAVAMVAYIALRAFLYWRGSDVLDEKAPTTGEFFLNPPKYFVVRRYEAIRRSAAILVEDGRG
jgi:hypothetical protein